MHVAAGTDLLTAFAALPRENIPHDEPQPTSPPVSVSDVVLIVIPVPSRQAFPMGRVVIDWRCHAVAR